MLTRRVRDTADGVGKSTIVTSLIKESFIPNVSIIQRSGSAVEHFSQHKHWL